MFGGLDSATSEAVRMEKGWRGFMQRRSAAFVIWPAKIKGRMCLVYIVVFERLIGLNAVVWMREGVKKCNGFIFLCCKFEGGGCMF